MVDKLSKYCKYLLIALMVLNVLFAFLGVLHGEESVGTFMVFAYCILGLTVVAILASPIFGIIINPQNLKKIGVILAIVCVVALLAWLISSVLDKPLSEEYLKTREITTSVDSTVNYFMSFTYIIMGATVAAVIYSVVMKIINK